MVRFSARCAATKPKSAWNSPPAVRNSGVWLSLPRIGLLKIPKPAPPPSSQNLYKNSSVFFVYPARPNRTEFENAKIASAASLSPFVYLPSPHDDDPNAQFR